MFFKVIGRVGGRFFGGLGRGLMSLFRWISRHEAGLGLVTVVLVVLVGGWLLLSLLNVNIVFGSPQAVPAPVVVTQTTVVPPTPLPAPTVAPVAHTNAPAATEAFMTGEINGNADQVWNALSANLHNELAGKGQDKTYYQRLFDTLKKAGTSYTGYQYVGGVTQDNGTSLHFYVLNAVDKDKKVTTIPFNFVVDTQDGHIVQIGPAAS